MNFLSLTKLAWRNLWRQKRRTILTLISIAFGTFFAVFLSATQDLTWLELIDNAARLGAGHVTIEHPEYRDQPTLTRSVVQTDAKRQAITPDEDVIKVVDRTSGSAMLSTASDSYGGFFIAFDPAVEDADTMEFTQNLVKGEMFENANSDGIILGEVLAKNLDAELGDKVVYTLTDRSGEIVSGMERVSGMVSTGSVSTDAGLVLLPIDTIRETIGYAPDESTQLAVFLGDSRKADQAAERIDELIGEESVVLRWYEQVPEIKSFIAMKVGGGRIMTGVLGLLVAAGIFNTIFMSVLERTREFGIMLAVGYTPGQLFTMIMVESGFLAVIGLGLGALVTAWPYHALNKTGLDMRDMVPAEDMNSMDIAGVGMDMVMPFGIFPETGIAIAVLIVGATMAAGIYPAWRAGRISPVESINLV